ncbi:MAG: radical SAM protein [Chloroflexota bacterium]|jgi:MoaA/NifB/PqqE/SkfB family radical SAM enzyme
MSQLEHFSVYTNLLGKRPSAVSPLQDLLPADREHGWHVARNLIKPLNHLEFLRHQEQIAAELNLHNTRTERHWFEANYALLERHQAGKISTAVVINHLADQLRQTDRPLSKAKIAVRLRRYATIRHMEFHPSDLCNLSCRGCTYGHDDPRRKPAPIQFPYHEIGKIAQLKPRSMVIIGGGEPTLYRDEDRRIQELVEAVCETNPGIALALVTNGTTIPPGEWPNRFSWIRVSLDAATAETYTTFRGKPMFDTVIHNYLRYLDYDVKYVGISFLFARSNIHDYAAVARLIFDLVKREKPRALQKANIQYRPLRCDPYRENSPLSEAVTPAQIEQAVREVRQLADSSAEMKAFLRDQTNITAILGGNTHPPHEFSRCFYSQTFRIVRANGDLRPCFIRVLEPDFLLGNILTDPLETIALNTLFVGARRKPGCDPRGCRQCHVNYTFEQGLLGTMRPSTSPEVLADPMY